MQDSGEDFHQRASVSSRTAEHAVKSGPGSKILQMTLQKIQKVCPICHRPFHWRKKWERCWDQVRFCSERCRKLRSKGASDISPAGSGEEQ